jgi:hypothetical protein
MDRGFLKPCPGAKPVDDFTLANDPPKETPWQPPPTEKARQKALFSGLDCLPGQEDLFPTDGQCDNHDSLGATS